MALPSPRCNPNLVPSPRAPASPKSPKALLPSPGLLDLSKLLSQRQPQWDPLAVLGIKNANDTVPDYRCVSFTHSCPPPHPHPRPPPSVCSNDSSRTIVPTTSSTNTPDPSSSSSPSSAKPPSPSSSPPPPSTTVPSPSFRCGWTIHSPRSLTRIRLLTRLMSVQMPDQIDHAQLLRLARACLCVEMHRRSGDEADVIYRWTNALEREASRLREMGVEVPPLPDAEADGVGVGSGLLDDTDDEPDDSERKERRRRRERRARRESETGDKSGILLPAASASASASATRMHKAYHLRLVRSGTTPSIKLPPRTHSAKTHPSSAPSSPVTQPSPQPPPTPGPHTSIPHISHTLSPSSTAATTAAAAAATATTTTAAAATAFPLSPVPSTHHLHLPPSPSHSHPQPSPTFHGCASAAAASAAAAAASDCARLLAESRAEQSKMLHATTALVARAGNMQHDVERLWRDIANLHQDIIKAGVDNGQPRAGARPGVMPISFCAGVLAGLALPYLFRWGLLHHASDISTPDMTPLPPLAKVMCVVLTAIGLGSALWACPNAERVLAIHE